MPDILVLSTPAAERLRVRRVPLARRQRRHRRQRAACAAASRGRVFRFGGRNIAQLSPAFSCAGQHARRWRDRSWLAAVRHHHHPLGAESPGARDIVFPLEIRTSGTWQAQVGGETLRLMFDVANEASVFNRPRRAHVRSRRRHSGGWRTRRAAGDPRSFHADAAGDDRALTVQGLGARTHVCAHQSRRSSARWRTMRLSSKPKAARRRRRSMLGRAALAQAGCSSISVNRRARTADIALRARRARANPP